MTERMSSRISSGEPPKLALPIQRGSVNIKNSLSGSFWKLIKFRPTLNVFKPCFTELYQILYKKEDLKSTPAIRNANSESDTTLRKRAMNYILRKICSRPRAVYHLVLMNLKSCSIPKDILKKLDQEKRGMIVVEIINNFESVGSL
jgi:hypothetical protein